MSACETQESEKKRLGAAAQLLLQRANDLFSCPAAFPNPAAAVPVHTQQPEQTQQTKVTHAPLKNDKMVATSQNIAEWEPDESFELL
jgi:hypothetical protein